MRLPVLFHIFDPTKKGIQGEIDFTWGSLGLGFSITKLVMYSITISLLAIPIFIFFYYGTKIRNQDKLKSKKSYVLRLSILFVSQAYILEIVGLPIITVFFRSFFRYWRLFNLLCFI